MKKCAELIDSLVGKRAGRMKDRDRIMTFENTEDKRGHKRKDEAALRHNEFEMLVGNPRSAEK